MNHVGPYAAWLLRAAIVLAAPAAACVPLGYMSSAFDAQRVAARYSLADRPTLVLVDDPEQRLRLPAGAATVANRVAFDLRQQGVLSSLIDQQKLADLSTKLGDRYARTPVDAIGRTLGAEQIIYLYVDAVSLQQEPGVLRAQAQVYVKVIDATASRRLFPTDEMDTAGMDRGYLVAAELPARPQASDYRAQAAGTLTDLADRTGVEVARLFYKHRREQLPLDRPAPR